MKCNSNCPAYCEETYYTGGSPIGIPETFCCINFEQCAPECSCKRTLKEVKTILNERIGKI